MSVIYIVINCLCPKKFTHKCFVSEELATMSVADLNKRFTFIYLQVAISKFPLPLSTDRLVQIMALNMYIIEETKLREDSTNHTYTYRSVCQDLSLSGDILFGLLLERCNLLVQG